MSETRKALLALTDRTDLTARQRAIVWHWQRGMRIGTGAEIIELARIARERKH
jgi:hypothetical protein